MPKVFLIITYLIFSNSLYALVVDDPNNLLSKTDQFIALNEGPACYDRTDYEDSSCKATCEEGKCNVKCNETCYGFFKCRYNSLNCTANKFDLWIKPGSEMGHQSMNIPRDSFNSSRATLEQGIFIFLNRYLTGDFSTKKGTLDFNSAQFTVENIQPDSFSVRSGLTKQVQKVIGELTVPVRGVTPKVKVRAEFWFGQDVLQTEQILKIVLDGNVIFSIYKLTEEYVRGE